ncbi:unnamed protein product [Brassica oleracea]
MIRRQLRRPQLRSAIRQRRGGDDLSLRQIVVELNPCRENYSDDDSDDHHSVEEANGGNEQSQI